MDLRQLRYFLAVVEYSSFSAAADSLNVTHPALGQQIRKLEDELGVQLFERHSRGVRVSSAGQRLAVHARDIAERFKLARQDMTAFSDSPTGRVRVGVTPSLGRALVPNLLEFCSDRYPDLALHFVQGFTGHLEQRLLSQEIDVSIVHSRIDTPHLESMPLFVEEICLVGHHDLVGALPDPVEPETLKSLPLILDERGQYTRNALREIIRDDAPIPRTIEVQAINIRREFVMKGTHCALVPRALFSEEIDRGSIEARSIALTGFTRTLGLATPRVESMPRSVGVVREAFVDLVEAYVAEGRFGWRLVDSDW